MKLGIVDYTQGSTTHTTTLVGVAQCGWSGQICHSSHISKLLLLNVCTDETLFHSSRYNPHHVLYRLLPRPKDTGHSLCQRAHNLTLPSDVGSTARQNFIMKMLFTDMYWWSFFTFQMLLCMFFVHIMYFPLFLLYCNASASVICAIKNYLLTYLQIHVSISTYQLSR